MIKISISERCLKAIKGSLERGAEALGDILSSYGKSTKISVDYSRSLKEMIKAGKYDREDENIIEENFPLPDDLKGAVMISIKLFHFDRRISSERAITEMNRAGYRPATLPELLALGEIRPELQEKFWIVALGSVWRLAPDTHYAPFLGFFGNERSLSLAWLEDSWPSHYRFLVVKL